MSCILWIWISPLYVYKCTLYIFESIMGQSPLIGLTLNLNCCQRRHDTIDGCKSKPRWYRRVFSRRRVPPRDDGTVSLADIPTAIPPL
jgi:hypothetical protein